MAIGIEGIKGAGMTYQGSGSTAEIKEAASAKTERTDDIQVSDDLAKATSALDVKETSTEGDSTESNANSYNPEDEIPHINEANQKQIKDAIDEINRRAYNSEAIFGIHDGTNRVTIKIVDKTTKKVIKELPPEKTLDMIERVWEMAGLMVDEKR